MNDPGPTLPTPGAAQSRPQQKHAVSPEEVLVQVTLHFMIFLGFILSRQSAKMSERGDYQEVLEDDIAMIRDGLDDVTETPPADLAHETNLAWMAEQRAVLLNQWKERRDAHPLFNRVKDFRVAGTAPAADGHASVRPGPLAHLGAAELASNDRFAELLAEARRLFGGDGPPDAVSPDLQAEIDKYVAACVEGAKLTLPQAGTDPAVGAAAAAAVPEDLRPLEQRGRFLRGECFAQNRDYLAEQIRLEFLDQRRQVAAIQRAATLKIGMGIESTSTDSRLIREQAVQQADRQIGLLPEVKAEFRRGGN